MTVYHVETKEAYDELMIELDGKGCKWFSGNKPTSKNYWEQVKENACIGISGKDITFRDIEQCKNQYPNIPIIEYKAKGEDMKMTQEEMKRYFLNESRDISIAIENFVVDDSTTENPLSEAKSSAKKLIEKIDECLETLKPKFRVGEYVTVHVNDRTIIAKIDELKVNDIEVHGLWYDRTLVNVKQDYWLSSELNEFRHATPEEITEYEVALTFHKHGRKPFEVKDGDLLENKFGKFIALKSLFVKENFTVEGNAFLKAAEEVNEWLENK